MVSLGGGAATAEGCRCDNLPRRQNRASGYDARESFPVRHRLAVGMQRFAKSVELPVPVEEAFAWHERPGALERLTPPWEQVELKRRDPGVTDGAEVEMVAKIGPFRKTWLARHFGYEPGRVFRDRQISGPFAHWEHTHVFEPRGSHGSLLSDEIEYRVPAGRLGQLLGGGIVRGKLERMFAYRHATTAADLATHAPYQEQRTMKVAITGASGLIGSELIPFLTTGGHPVTRVVRGTPGPGEVRWSVRDQTIDAAGLEGHDAVVHLAGESIAAGRWTEARKKRIRDSRVQGTSLLCETLAKLERQPSVLVCASAIGYYPDSGDQPLQEDSPAGNSFLAEVCRDWEAAAAPAIAAGIRVVFARFGIILSPRGGALAKMLTPFKLGVGGRIGSGKQYWSWIGIDDVIGALHHALMNNEVRGPMNVVAPNPLTNKEFTKVLGKVLGRPTIFPMPAFAAKLALGEMADELLLTSMRVIPRKLADTGYNFRHPQLEGTLRHVLGR